MMENSAGGFTGSSINMVNNNTINNMVINNNNMFILHVHVLTGFCSFFNWFINLVEYRTYEKRHKPTTATIYVQIIVESKMSFQSGAQIVMHLNKVE